MRATNHKLTLEVPQETGGREAQWTKSGWKDRKTWEVIQVGKSRFYWVAYRPAFSPHQRWEKFESNTVKDSSWLIADGFASTREEARALSQAAARAGGPGWYYPEYPGMRGCYGTWQTRAIYRERHAHKTKGHFPLLALTSPFTRRDVIRAFRRRAHELHPDHGGNASRFRKLVAERERAWSMAAPGPA